MNHLASALAIFACNSTARSLKATVLGAILVPVMGAVASIAEGRPLMAGSTLRSLFEGDCSGFET